MRKLCSDAEAMWKDLCAIVSSGNMENYTEKWNEYRKHRNTCQECQDLLMEYWRRSDNHVRIMAYNWNADVMLGRI